MINRQVAYRVIIIGGDHYNTYGVVRSLGEEGIKSEVLILGCATKESFVLRSKYVDRGLGCNDHEEAIKQLKSMHAEGVKQVVICCSDEAEALLLDNYDILSPAFILPVCSDYKDTFSLMNKGTITELAKQFDIEVPKTWRVLDRFLPDGISFPCITKPITSTRGHKSDIVVCKNKNELQNVVNDKRRCSDYVVQEYLEYEREISILGAVLSNGKVLLSGCIEKLRTCMIGTTSFGKMVNNSLLGANLYKLEALMKSTGYRGLFSAEFLVKDGLIYFLEVNFRNDGNTYVATASGQNLPLRYVQSFVGDDVVQDSSDYPCYFMLDIEDFLALKRNNVSIWQWIRDVKKANTYLVYNAQDRKPFIKKTKNIISSIVYRVWHKLA